MLNNRRRNKNFIFIEADKEEKLNENNQNTWINLDTVRTIIEIEEEGYEGEMTIYYTDGSQLTLRGKQANEVKEEINKRVEK